MGDNMSGIRHRKVAINGIELHLAEAGEGYPVILLHGFPELWYSWHNQLEALSESGFHAIAPDLRGFGESEGPEETAQYSMKKLEEDVIGLLEALKVDSATVVGHDWGARIAWNCALDYPGRVDSVVAIGVPWYPRGEVPPSEWMNKQGERHFSIVNYFQKPGVAEIELEKDIRRSMLYFLSFLYANASLDLLEYQYMGKSKECTLLEGMPEDMELPDWLCEADLEYYIDAYSKSGFGKALNIYRNMDLNWREAAKRSDGRVEQPALFMAGDRDPATLFGNLEPMETMIRNLRKTRIIPQCGHLPQLQYPEIVNDEIIRFLKNNVKVHV